MKPIVFVATSRPEKSLAFYRDTLELPLTEDQPYALVFDAGGCQLRVQKVEQVIVQPYTAAGWEVDDIDQMVNKLFRKRVFMERFPFLDQDKDGIWTTPDGARIAWFKDPDENLLSLTEFSPA